MKIKVTGYFTPEPEEIDEDSPTGLTEEAYMDLINDEDGGSLKIAELHGIEVEKDGR